MKTLLVYSNVDGFAVQLKNHIEDAFDELQIEWKECHITEVAKVNDEFQPTMNLFFHPNKTIYEYLDVIQNLKGHKLLWDMESPYESDLVFDMAKYFYYIFTSDMATAEELKKEYPNNSIKFVPHACNPKIHKPMDVPFEYRSDLFFGGNAYESRIKWINDNSEDLKNKMFILIGVGYRGVANLNSQKVIHGHVSEAEIVKYCNGAKVVLNLHRVNSDLDMANKRGINPKHLNNRFYEVAAMGKQQLVENRDDMLDEINKVLKMKPEEYSYVSRLKEFYLPLLKGIGK